MRDMVFTTSYAGQFNKAQLVLMTVLEAFYHIFCQQIPYHREIFEYKDGCKIALDWAYHMPKKVSERSEGARRVRLRDVLSRRWRKKSTPQKSASADPLSTEFAQSHRPILIIYPGIGSNETELYIQNAIRHAYRQGYLPVLVQHRGESGLKIASERTIGCGFWADAVETITYIHSAYC